jgi:exosortase A-associated hydrolase 2
MALPESEIRPLFLGESPGKHYIVQFRPVDEPRSHIVYIPPFGEEMNRCRALVAEQARAFAAAGHQCTLVDFYGTGDSEGHLVDANLQIWRENVEATLNFVTSGSDAPITLWGLRLGALLALEFASSLPVQVEKLLLWQPATSGKRFVSQLLRQRVASLVNSGLEGETTSEIRKRLQAGESVEVSGYVLAEPLIAGLEQLKIPEYVNENPPAVLWLENSDAADEELPTSSRKAVDALSKNGLEVLVERFTAPPIWQLHKRDLAPDLVDKTLQLLA